MSGPAAHSRRVSSRAGTRTATVPVPEVTSLGTSGRAGTISDNGPGQNRAARSAAASGQDAQIERACSRLPATSGSGLPPSRPLASRTARPTSGFSARPPTAYRVSVG